MNKTELKPIAKIYSGFNQKFGIPRQSGVIPTLKAKIVFEPEYRDPSAIKGIEEFSHLWLIWYFSETERKDWSPTVRPPRLGGNKRIGVFATRSPFRPNPIGLSCVKLEKVIIDKINGPVLEISGADLMNETPIFDIKPYLPYCDCKTDAVGGFTDNIKAFNLKVIIPDEIKAGIDKDTMNSIIDILSNDPRPHYQNDENREYGLSYSGYEIKFRVKMETVYVFNIYKL